MVRNLFIIGLLGALFSCGMTVYNDFNQFKVTKISKNTRTRKIEDAVNGK